MGQENSGADQTHYCRHCLNHCQRSFAPCATENGGHLAQSKRFPGANTQSRSTEDFAQQTWIFCDPVAGAAVIGAPGAAHECPLEAAREDGAKHQATPNRGGEISSESMLIFRRELRFERGRRREHRH